MTRLTVRPFSAAPPPAAAPDGRDLTDGWVPHAWLGAPAPGGLALPSGAPTRAGLYSPRGVWLDGDRLVAVDSGNHRVLIWHGVPDRDGRPADVVLGQPDGTTEGRATGGPERGMNLPVGVLVHDGALVVADAWHHRILVWDAVPQADGVPPNRVLGQDDLSGVAPNRGRDCAADTLYWPFGMAVVGDRFWVADTGNRRVLGWAGGLPAADRPADVVLGQPDAHHREENRGAPVGPDGFRWPHALAGTADLLLVADAGDHRVLGFAPSPAADGPAALVLGQPDPHTAGEWPYGPHTGDRLRFPYAVVTDGDRLAVADTANNRVLLWDGVPRDNRAADHVLGQRSFGANGENRWSGVEHDTFCWPYGLALHGDPDGSTGGDLLAVADSGNNRVMLWRRAGR